MPLAAMVAIYGPEVVLVQDHIALRERLYILSLLQPAVTILKEKFIRGCKSSYTPQKAYDHNLLLTGNELEAARARAWQILNQTAS